MARHAGGGEGIALHNPILQKGGLAMRCVVAILFALIVGSAGDTARADPYRWCAEYSDDLGGSANCYFLTLEQCQWAIGGNGGFCRENGFYTGPDAPPQRRRPRR
jgi:hypothetical protein